MVNILLDQPLFSLTVGQFLELQKQTSLVAETTNVVAESQTTESTRFVHSLREAAACFDVSVVTFQRWKNEGLFSFTQIGRKCTFDIEKIRIELSNRSNGKKKGAK